MNRFSFSLLRTSVPAAFLSLFCFSMGARGDALEQASVTEAVNTVSYQTSADAPQKKASPGTIIHPDNIVRTGVNSRAELQFTDKTITRMGSSSVFSFDAKAQRMNLRQGTALFSKPKDSDSFEIATPAATCSISGTTGFIEVVPGGKKGQPSFVFGLVEGETSVTMGGKTYPVTSGQMLVTSGRGEVHFVDFNIETFLAKAALIRKFKTPLPNQKEIEQARKHFASLVKRGFIEPTDLAFASNSDGLQLLETLVNESSPDQDLRQLGTQVLNFEQGLNRGRNQQGESGFLPIGNDALIRGQLVWTSPVDLDLHLQLPDNAGEVYYGNKTVTFNNGNAKATLDADNLGGVVDVAPDKRVENIVVTGTPAGGIYSFYAYYYSGSGPVSYTLTTTGDNGHTTQVQTGTLTTPNTQGVPAVVTH